MKEFSTDNIVQRKDDHLIVSELGNELVMMDMQNGSYLTFNKTARTIWELIEKPVKIKDIINSLTNRFSVDEETCRVEIINFLTRLAEQKALRIQE